MSNYILNNTASNIDTALGKVLSPDTSPQATDNLVTSGGVKLYVDDNLGPFINKTLTTESVGIAATDNDTSIPTCAAVNAAIGGIGNVATYGVSSGTSSDTVVLPITETSDTHSLGTVTNGVVTLGAGTYLVSYFGQYREDDDDFYDYWNIQLRHNGSAKLTARVNETNRGGDGTYVTVSGTTAVVSDSPQTVDINAQEVSRAGLSYINVVLTIVKLG